ncbi:MAG: DNA topoisomerase IB, partial [Verrucomicrobiota bacterium]|nr:DNA topoisomerase IB [Verrucomicrobiota bacterium]
PAICRKCYVHPAVLETYLSGEMIEGLRHKTEAALTENHQDLKAVEVAVMQFLQARLSEAKK